MGIPRYCVLCGRRLRTGIKYCSYCKNPSLNSEKKPNLSTHPMVYLIAVVIIALMIIVGFYPEIEDWKPSTTMIIVFIVIGFIALVYYSKWRKDNHKTVLDDEIN